MIATFIPAGKGGISYFSYFHGLLNIQKGSTMTVEVKKFEELSVNELYAILQLRAGVFVVEQKCAYQDLDGNDQKALHIIGTKNAELVAYTRIFKPVANSHVCCIGRVVVRDSQRTHGYGRMIMKASLEAVNTYFKETSLQLSAQIYLRKFYKSLGFREVGEEYMEDGIPHIKMILND